MSLLTIVQNAVVEIGFGAKPSSVANNSDKVAQQMLSLVNREGDALSRYNWEALVKEHTFTLVDSDQDYATPAGFRYMIPNTIWNRDNKRPVRSPLTSQEWQFYKGWSTVTGLVLRARIRNQELEFDQAITTADNGKTIAYEYVSSYWAETVGGVAKAKFTLDDDESLLDEELLTMGLIWRFKKAKSLDYSSDLAEYTMLVNQAKARDGSSRKVVLNKPNSPFLGANTPEDGFG